jgi:polyisoprenoid-binding protein YceI
MKKILLALMLLFSTSTVALASETWVFDRAHSKIGFSVSHLVITDVEGLFKSYSGTVKTDDNNFEGSQVNFEIDVASIDTDIEKRDNHLKSAEFFNADQFPKIMFKSTSFTKVEGNKYKLVGDLTIRDVTKPVELDVVYNGMVKNFMGKDKAGFKLMGEINRFDYGLTWNKLMETGGAVVGKTVYIEGNIQLDKK